MIAREASEGLAHGGRLKEARRLFPGAPEPFLDLSTGINPIPYPLPPLSPEWFTRLPEPEALAELQSVAANAYGVAGPSMIVPAPGTQILIDLLPRLWDARSVAILGPSYAEYARAWARAGCIVTEVRDIEALGSADVAVVCNPNNPDGRRISRERLLLLADRLAVHRGLVLVDEAFADLEGNGLSLAGALPHPALIVLRSFGKTFGLAGLRLGFALASPARAAAIRSALGLWAVSGPAIAIGCQALADRAWMEQAAVRLHAAVRRLDDVLLGAGLRVIGGTRLFRLVETEQAEPLFRRLGEAGILVRRFDEDPWRLRFGLPADAGAWERLRLALSG